MKKYNAFSLVEVLITLLVLSLVFTAMIPVFVNSKVSPGEAPWRYVVNGTLSNVAGVYGAASDSSPVVIGANKIPVDSKVAAGDANALFGKQSPKLMIVSKPEDSETPPARRHLIDFFQADSDGTYTNIGKFTTDKYGNIAIGRFTLENLDFDAENGSRGKYNIAIGDKAMSGCLSDDGSYCSPTTQNTGTGIVAIGRRSLNSNTTGFYNTAVGDFSLYSNTTGYYNTALGRDSLHSNTTGNYNTAVGDYSLYSNTTGNYNVAIGYHAGDGSDSSNKLYIEGNGVSYTGSNALIYGDFSTRLLRLNGKSVYVGTNDATTVRLYGSTVYVGTSGSTVYIKGSSYSTSDARLKNIGADFTSGLDKIDKINVKHFTFKDDKTKTPRVGVIAQDLQKIFPNSVTKDDKGFLNINKDEMFYAVINSVKELHQMFTDFCSSIKSSVDSLAAKVVDLDKRVSALEKASCACDCGKNCDCERCACDIGCSCGCDVCKNGTCGCSTGKKTDCKCGCGDSSKVACGCATKKVACSCASAKGCSCAAVKTSKCSSDLNSRLSELEKQNADLKKQTEELQKQVKFLMSRQK
ncbi:MAG: tail fiber domain-containing protein [Candidatus Gastranaerophilaceae bacterium]